jgi:hypothetical protein
MRELYKLHLVLRRIQTTVPLVALLVLYAMPHRIVDPDSLGRLATGRFIVEHGALPVSDPFTFARPEYRLTHAEWLGDVAWFGAYRAGGEGAVVALAMGVVALGWVLAFACGVGFGAPPVLVAGLLLAMLPASAERLTARNDIHALWLAPMFVLLSKRAARDARACYALLALGWVWANLHASFLIGFAIVLAALVQARVQGEAVPRRAWLVACALPALPLLGPAGADAYRQLADHALGASVYRSLILEWQSSWQSLGVLAVLPLHVLALLGAAAFGAAFLRGKGRAHVLELALFALGVVLAYSSRRFLPLMAVLAAPSMAAVLAALWRALPRKLARVSITMAAAIAVLYVGLGMRSALRRPDMRVLEREDGAQRAARFIAAHAPAGSRLFNAFNDGSWLLWLTAPRVQHYIDPRNNLGADFLARYVHEVLPDPQRFEQEARAHAISLVLVRGKDPKMQALARHLRDASDYRLVYWDGYHALYARVLPRNAALIDRFGYRVLRADFDLEYLKAPGVATADLQRDLRELRSQSPALATALTSSLTAPE